MKNILLVFAMVLLYGCTSSGTWTDSDKENIEHFFNSKRADEAAIRISNSKSTFTPFTINEHNEFIKLKEKALLEAKLVKDEVLTKAHSELPGKFRNYFQKSLSLQLEAIKQNSNELSMQAGVLHDQWVDWFNQNKKSIKIPKKN